MFDNAKCPSCGEDNLCIKFQDKIALKCLDCEAQYDSRELRETVQDLLGLADMLDQIEKANENF